MKKVLIIGENSYIGDSFAEYIDNCGVGDVSTDIIGSRDRKWEKASFSGYDSVFFVAGIAHVETKKISKEEENLYYSVNTELVWEAAKKAKSEGVSQFIFMSSAIIYGNSAPIGKSKMITRETKPSPATVYGDSKLRAENKLLELADKDSFRVVIIRSPMVYGRNCKGNFRKLEHFAYKMRVFPYVENCRSMIYIKNLCEFVRLMIVNEEAGIFFPANKEYINTSEMVRTIAQAGNKKLKLIKGFVFVLKITALFTPLVNKAFGSITYEKDLSVYKENYNIFDFEQSIWDIEEQ